MTYGPSDIWFDIANDHERRLVDLAGHIGRLSLQIGDMRRVGLADVPSTFTNEDGDEENARVMRTKMEALFVANEDQFREIDDKEL